MINGMKIAFVYVGLVIGAGFASGREIFEYFNLRSRESILPVILAFSMFFMISYIILYKAKKYRICDFGEFVDKVAGRLGKFIKLIMYLFMFCGFFVMLSAGGELFESGLGINHKWGVGVLSLICFIVFSFDIKGIVAINTILVPFMIAGISYLSVTSLIYGSVSASSFSITQNSLVSAVCYVSYNTITAGAVLVPLYSILDKKAIKYGALLGSGALCLLILLIRAVLNMYYDRIFYSEMPMLDLAVIRGIIYQYIYTTVLFTSICTTAVSHGFGVLSRFRFKTAKHRVVGSAAFCLAALPFSDLNFSFLVSSLYSVFGYIGILWMGIIVFKK